MLYYIRDDNNNLMESKQTIQSIILHPEWVRFFNYDFTEWKEWTNFSGAANNFGHIYQDIGYLKKYDWNISFDLNVFLEK